MLVLTVASTADLAKLVHCSGAFRSRSRHPNCRKSIRAKIHDRAAKFDIARSFAFCVVMGQAHLFWWKVRDRRPLDPRYVPMI